MKSTSSFFFLALLLLLLLGSSSAVNDGPIYDHTAYTDCRAAPEPPLYNGGIWQDQPLVPRLGLNTSEVHRSFPSFILNNLTANTYYVFSSWMKISGGESSFIKACITSDNTTYNCVGSMFAKSDCWSFFKGGFLQDQPSPLSFLYLQTPDAVDVNITLSSISLQPFTEQEWTSHQQQNINILRKRPVVIHATDTEGLKVEAAKIRVQQVSKDFPFGCAISLYILRDFLYRKWFAERFNVAVFENELKWDYTERFAGVTNYTLPDLMLQYLRANRISVRGHNIFWSKLTSPPLWARNLTGPALKTAVDNRLHNVLTHYKNQFIHWDVNNEMIHYNFYENALGPNASLGFYETAQKIDPLATLFLNEYNQVETCNDQKVNVDSHVAKIKELQEKEVKNQGFGLQGHFTVPNPPMIRAVLDKYWTTGLPVWLTEVDISKTIDNVTQAIYLETVLREVYSHPAVNGIMLWASFRPYGCYQMCLTDKNFKNLPAGDTVDKLLQEWSSGVIDGETDDHGSFSFHGFLGEYEVSVTNGTKTAKSRFAVSRSVEPKHFTIQL